MYLSDLRYLDNWQRERLARNLEHIPLNDVDLKKWNDALVSLSRYPPQATVKAVREPLLQSLSRLQ